ncbi:MAG TPA: hypothetical protein VFI27_04225 [candidate division Zixibacteria bacterium]|nr:hypothetical protein [candidate division Zixibacteria bacterium]
MANQYTYEEKGKVQPKPEHEGEIPQKAEGPLMVSDLEGKLDADTLTKMQQTVGNTKAAAAGRRRNGHDQITAARRAPGGRSLAVRTDC